MSQRLGSFFLRPETKSSGSGVKPDFAWLSQVSLSVSRVDGNDRRILALISGCNFHLMLPKLLRIYNISGNMSSNPLNVLCFRNLDHLDTMNFLRMLSSS